VLRVDKLTVRGLPPLSFTVPAGECLAVEGASGSGKTLLLRAIADLDPARGYVFLEGAERGEMSAAAWRSRVRYVAAEPGWWGPTARQHMPGKGDRIERLMAAVGLEASMLDRLLAAVSTGERQRMALVRALLDEPRVLLLDEPSAALDQQSAVLVEELIRFQILAGRSILLVSHDAGQIERLAHARLLLGGRSQPDLRPGAAA
jgi:ABC-type iron transport system FetAB ATPase subunit